MLQFEHVPVPARSLKTVQKSRQVGPGSFQWAPHVETGEDESRIELMPVSCQ